MKSIVVGLVIRWVVSELTAAAGNIDWAGLKTKIHAAIAAAIPVAFIDAQLDAMADSLIDAVQKMAADQGDLIAAITALANKNLPAAEAALKALLAGALTGDLAQLVSAV